MRGFRVGEAIVNQVTNQFRFFFFCFFLSLTCIGLHPIPSIVSGFNDNSWPKYSVGLSLFFSFFTRNLFKNTGSSSNVLFRSLKLHV